MTSSTSTSSGLYTSAKAESRERSTERSTGGSRLTAIYLWFFQEMKSFPGLTTTLILSFCIAVALGSSGYLFWADLTSSPIAGCGGGGGWIDCENVASSRWSIWFGIPVSLLAIGIYIVMAAALVAGSVSRFSHSIRAIGWTVVAMTAFAAGLTAVWFIGVQFLLLKHICSYCMVAHTVGLIASVTMLLASPLRAKATATAALFSFAGTAVLVVGQFFTTPPETYRIERFEAPVVSEPEGFDFAPPSLLAPGEEPASESGQSEEAWEDDLFEAPVSKYKSSPTPLEKFVDAYFPSEQTLNQPGLLSPVFLTTGILADSGEESEQPEPAAPRIAAIQGGAVKLNLAQWPHIGPSDAKYVVVEVFDYYCPACRDSFAAVAGAREKMGDELAVMLLPVPLNADCNSRVRITNPMYRESCEVTRLAIAVWRVDPIAFEAFHNWMLGSQRPPNYAAAKAKVATLVDVDKLNAELASGIADKYIAKHVEIYRRIGEGTIPKLMFPRTSVVGKFSSADGLIDLIRREGS